MASSEDRAYEIMRELDVSYVLVIFGGLTGYASDGKLIRVSNSGKCEPFWPFFKDSREFKKLRRQMQRKRHIKSELCVK